MSKNNWVWVKLALLCANAISTYHTATPPNAVPTDAKKVAATGPETILTRLMWVRPTITYGYAAMCAAEAITILAARYPQGALSKRLLSTFLFGRNGTAPTSQPSRAFLLGSASIISGAAIRLLCYRALKEHFTFVISDLKDHKLITAGPYAVVRHPSYIAAVFGLIGILSTLLAPGSWIRKCEILNTSVGSALFKTWVVTTSSIILMLLPRARLEDEFLKKKFGKEWEEYARRVPYWFIPWLI